MASATALNSSSVSFSLGLEKAYLFVLHRNQMYVRMRHFQPQYRFSYLSTREGLANGKRHSLGENMHRRQILIVQIEDIIYFLLGNDQCMTFYQRIDVKERKESVILRHLVARYFTCDNSTEYCCHSYKL